MSEKNEPQRITSTPLASYLLTEGFTLQDIVFDNSGYATFFFNNNSPQLQERIRDFELLRATANATLLIENYQKLVKRIKRGF